MIISLLIYQTPNTETANFMLPQGTPPQGPFAFFFAGRIVENSPRLTKKAVWTGNGPHDVPITAMDDGAIIFEFDKAKNYAGGATPAYTLPYNTPLPPEIMKSWNKRQELSYRRVKYINAFFQALYSGISAIQRHGVWVQTPANPANYFLADYQPTGWVMHPGPQAQKPEPFNSAFILNAETLEYTINLMKKIDAQLGSIGIDVLELIYISSNQYVLHQFPSAHLISWAVVEKLVNALWADLLAEIDIKNGGHTTIGKPRKKLLTGRDYTASIMTQMLSTHKKIDDGLLARLDAARGKRNQFAHSLAMITANDAQSCLQLAADMLGRMVGERVLIQASLHSMV